MKNLFIEVKYTGKMNFPNELIEQLPKRVVLAGSIQYLDYLPKLKKFLEDGGKEVTMFQSRHGQYPGQILGCDIFKFNSGVEFDAFVYLGDGMFHPTALLFGNKKSVFIYNPMSEKIEVLDTNMLDKVEKKKKALLTKFLLSKNIGILVTQKPGQNQSKAVDYFREEIKKKDPSKKVYVFLADNINFQLLENFNFIDVWINTACPRIVQDFSCLNLRDLQEIDFFSGELAAF